MPVAKKVAAAKTAAPAKKATQSRSRAAQAGASTGTSTDPVYVRLQALSFARSLYGDATGGDDTPIISASKLSTAARRLERYLTGQDTGDADS